MRLCLRRFSKYNVSLVVCVRLQNHKGYDLQEPKSRGFLREFRLHFAGGGEQTTKASMGHDENSPLLVIVTVNR